MIRLTVSNSEEPGQSIGPAPFFRLTGGTLQIAPDFHVVAHHLGFIWECNGHLYKKLESDVPIVVHFEGQHGAASETAGPFARFQVIDGVAYADGERLAKLLEGQERWCLANTEECWPVMVLRPSHE